MFVKQPRSELSKGQSSTLNSTSKGGQLNFGQHSSRSSSGKFVASVDLAPPNPHRRSDLLPRLGKFARVKRIIRTAGVRAIEEAWRRHCRTQAPATPLLSAFCPPAALPDEFLRLHRQELIREYVPCSDLDGLICLTKRSLRVSEVRISSIRSLDPHPWLSILRGTRVAPRPGWTGANPFECALPRQEIVTLYADGTVQADGAGAEPARACSYY